MDTLNNQNWKNIWKQLRTKKITIIDNFFKDKIAGLLKEKMLNTKSFHDYYLKGYQARNFYNDNPILNEVIKDLESVLPLLKNSYQRGWSFIYNNECIGVDVHTDPAWLSLNIWVTPDSCVKDFTKNGLTIYLKKSSKIWTYEEKDSYYGGKAEQFLKEQKAKKKIIDYKYNRAVFFDAAFFHKTNGVSMKPGEKNRGVSYTLLFGEEVLEKGGDEWLEKLKRE